MGALEQVLATLEQVQLEFTEAKEKLEEDNDRCVQARARVAELHPQVRKVAVEKEASAVEQMEAENKRMEAEELEWEDKFEKEEKQLIDVRERHHNAKRDHAALTAEINGEDAEANLKLEAERKKLDEMVKAHEAVALKIESTSTKADALYKRVEILKDAINGDEMLEGYFMDAEVREKVTAQRIQDLKRWVREFQVQYVDSMESAERLENEIQDIKESGEM